MDLGPVRLSGLRGDVIRIARNLASSRGLSFAEAFDDSLEADLARLAVARSVRRARPDITLRTIAELVNEVLVNEEEDDAA
jgi:hypothetical protein